MIVKQVQRERDGKISLQWLIDQDQQVFLMNFALEFLVAKGLISVSKVSEEDLAKMELELEEEVKNSFLENIPKEEMGSA